MCVYELRQRTGQTDGWLDGRTFDPLLPEYRIRSTTRCTIEASNSNSTYLQGVLSHNDINKFSFNNSFTNKRIIQSMMSCKLFIPSSPIYNLIGTLYNDITKINDSGDRMLISLDSYVQFSVLQSECWKLKTVLPDFKTVN